jgi:dipeptidyl aminopeptidase/acylaminoacyl peptidase
MASAFMREVEPGEIVNLDDDEGLLVVAVDSDIALRRVRVERSSSGLSWASVRGVATDTRALRLYVAPQGKYRWEDVQLEDFDAVYDVSDDDEFHFAVQAGRINYPGDLLFRSVSIYQARIHVANRALTVIDWLSREHSALYSKYELGYSGHFGDPFPAFYRAERGRLGQTSVSAAPEPPLPQPRAGSPALLDYLRSPRLLAARINPRGDLIAVVAVDQADNGKRTWVVDLYDMGSASATRLIKAEFGIATLEWSGDHRLVIGVGEPFSAQAISIVHVIDGAPRRRFELMRIPRAGQLVDSLPDDPDHILFASRDVRDRLLVHRVDVRDQEALDDEKFRTRDRIDPEIDGVRQWFTDGAGRLRMALVVRDGSARLLHGAGDRFEVVHDFNDNEDVYPLSLSADGNTLYALSDHRRAQRELVAFDLVKRTIVGTLVAKSGYDINSVVLDAQRRVIGGGYRRNGVQVTEYSDFGEKKLGEALGRAFPDASVGIIDRSADNRYAVVMVESSVQPPRMYYVDAKSMTAELLDEAMPWLASRTLAPSRVVRAKSPDGFMVEGFLTVPPGQEKRPLVVMPHGGPLDTADERGFDGEVQLLAAMGYAVLQVNFRGSEGYGKAFREAGKRALGAAIEDDIDLILKQALIDTSLDDSRICMVGASYGGYSALVSVVRWPKRFRCAVSISGVTDRILRFTASDNGRSAEGRAQLIEIHGDPRTHERQFIEHSPVYRYRDIVVPVMLVHGTEDWRVDYEHSQRLQRMLGMAGRAPVFLTLHGEAHSFMSLDVRLRQWRAIVGFLQQHLDPPPSP